MSGNVDITFTSKENDLYKSQAKLIKQQEEMIEKYKKLATEAKKGGKDAEKAAAAAAKELDRFAKATSAINRTPLEKYADQMRRLDQALKAGKISQETFNRAVGKAKTEFDTAGQSSQKAFGAVALGALSSYAAGIVSITGLLSGASRVLSDIKTKGEEFATLQRSSMPETGPLAQLAMGDKTKMRELLAAARATYGAGAGATEGEAAKLQFEIASASYDQYRKEIAELKASGAVPDPVGLLVGAAAFETNVGKEKTGGFPRITSMLLGAAGKSPGEIPGIALGGAEAAVTGVSVGMTPQEILAATAVQAKALGSPTEGGVYAKNLFKGIDEGIKKKLLQPGRNLEQYMADIAALEAKGMKDYDIVGNDIRAYSGYRQLKRGMGAYHTSMEEIRVADEGNAFGAVTSAYRADPQMIAARTFQRSKAGRDLAGGEAGVWSNLAQSVQNDAVTRMMKKDDRSGAAIEDWAVGLARWFKGDKEFVEDYKFRASEETQQDIRDAAALLKESAQLLRDSSDNNRQRSAAAVMPE